MLLLYNLQEMLASQRRPVLGGSFQLQVKLAGPSFHTFSGGQAYS